MIDLVCLVADKNMEAAIESILRRSAALQIREIRFETIRHPNSDPGCFFQSAELLRGYRSAAAHALVMLDRAWEGAPASSGSELESTLETSLERVGLLPWARAIVIDPELEAWVFSDSPNVALSLGWLQGMPDLREALVSRGLWNREQTKPADPKAAVEWTLRSVRKPRSSAIYRELASKVSLERCEDRSFLRLRSLLTEWFGPAKPKEL